MAGGDCSYWLHTHVADGILHVESPSQRTYIGSPLVAPEVTNFGRL